MPELPEVQTTVNGLNKKVKGAKIIDVWSIYNSPYYKSKENIKDPKFFTEFKNRIIGAKIINAERRAKNILINLDNKETILIHMKMTGHLMFGEYTNTSISSKTRSKATSIKSDDPWKPTNTNNQALNDPFNSHIRLVFSLSLLHKKSEFTERCKLVLSDTRKFAKVTVIKTDKLFHSSDLAHLGPEPLNKEFNFEIFKDQINKKPNGKIKTVLLDQTIIAGIGNIYSDEALWLSNIHPESIVRNIPQNALKKLFKSILTVLTNGIDFGGDSMSDYRNIDGEKGSFQEQHNVYRKKGELCSKTECKRLSKTETGKTKEVLKYTIKRIVVGGRSTHYCENHQTKY
jgi:formamidopyrimidine-DNA glycosylase